MVRFPDDLHVIISVTPIKNVIMVPSMVFGQIYGIFSSFDLGDVIAFYFELNNCIMLARGSSQ